MIFSLLILLTHIGAGARDVPRGHCAPEEEVFFTCVAKNKKEISVCGTGNKAEYRFGRQGKAELSVPAASWNTVMYSGGGGAYIRFPNQDTQYIVFSKIVRGEGDSAGVLIFKNNRKIAQVLCTGEGLVKESSLEKSNLPKEGDAVDPLIQ